MKRKGISDKIFFTAVLVTAVFLICNQSFLLKIYDIDPAREIKVFYQGYKLKEYFGEKKEAFNSYYVQEDEEPEYKATVVEKKVINRGNVNYKNVALNNQTSYTVDIPEMMKDYRHISKKDNKQILIIHTHGTEAYNDQKTARTKDISKNVVAVGEVLSEELKKRGYRVLHDVKMHDDPSYNGSYLNCLNTLKWYFEYYDDIGIVLDVHRDAIEENDGSRVKLSYGYDNGKYAQLMFVSGSDNGGLEHKNFKENLKFAISLQSTVNSMYDGLMRPIDFRKERFNQHMHSNYLILEVGTHGNTIDEAKNSMKIFAEALDKYLNENN